MTRILFIDHCAQLGGAELCLLDLASHYRDSANVLLFEDGPFHRLLADQGVPVQLVSAPTALMAVRRGSRLSGVLGGFAAVAMAMRLRPVIRSFDLIHCNSQKAFIVGSIAGALASRPVVWHLHDILTAPEVSRFNRKVSILLANRFTAGVITNSQATAGAFVAAGGDPKKVKVLYNGIRTDSFLRQSGEATALRKTLGIDDSTPVIGCFSRLAPWKGQHVLLQAVARLRGRYPKIRALLVGSPLFGEVEYEVQLKRYVSDQKLTANVQFLGFQSDVPAIMSACDLVVHTSVSPEPFGRVIVEGMLAGKPVIATAAGGVVELVTHEETGLLVNPGDSSALAEAIIRLQENQNFTRTMAEAGRRSAMERFSLERHLESFAGLIAEILT